MRTTSKIKQTGALALAIGLSVLSCGEAGGPADPNDPAGGDTDALVSGHEVVALFSQIPAATIASIRTNYRIYYGHTSHGSQIVTGMRMLEAEDASYALPDLREPGGDLGHNGSTTWATTTRAFLDAHPGEYNVVMWSWCGGVSDNTEQGIQTYLDTMNQLEEDYPNVIFIYMTGHLDGGGTSGNLYVRNNQIRDYVAANNKILFDFADIESYDPEGTFYPNESDGCAWCSNWCSTHSCSTCGGCSHSHCFNCYQKGKAFWYLMARISGWEPDV